MRNIKSDLLPKPVKGINTIANETDIPEGFVRDAVNGDFDKEGNYSVREGYELIYSADNPHSVYKRFFCEGNLLKFIDTDNIVSIIAGLKSTSNYLSYTEINSDIVFTDGIGVARILPDHSNELLAPPNMVFQPEAKQQAEGSLSGGTYQYAMCNISDKGTISGTGLAASIDISHGNGILFSGIYSADYNRVLFVSNANGTELYFRAILPLNTNEYLLQNIEYEGYALDTQFMTQLPAGQIIRYFKGKIYVADNNVLWFSQAHRYGLCKLSEDFIQFPGRITIVEPVNDGIYVVSDKTYFLRGTNSDSVILDDFISEDTAIEGSGLQVTGADFGIKTDSNIAFWVSDKGLVLGLPGGNIKNLTENNIAIDTNFIKGSSMYREVDGKKQILTALNGGGDKSTFTSTDTITSTIIRNGVEIVE